MKGLYVHIPFCEAICHYCDFVKRIPKDEKMIDIYLDALQHELMTYETHFSQIDTIYIGGGTPSMLSLEQLDKLFTMLSPIDPIEYTIEVNPESYTKDKGILFKKHGINRVSLGVQTFNETILKKLNRKHKNEDVYQTVSHLKSLDIENISIDLIYALPGQSIEDVYKDLEIIKALDLPHISCYSLILEEKTVFHHQFLNGLFTQAPQDLEAQMYEQVILKLKQMGYEHYEISNFSKAGKKSLHNLLYWSNDPYIGIGLGAHGFVDGQRTNNHRQLPLYLKSPTESKEVVTRLSMMQDMMIFGLRKIEGVSIKSFHEQYGVSVFDQFDTLKEKIEEGLLEIENDMLKLTHRGLFLGNQVFMVFV